MSWDLFSKEKETNQEATSSAEWQSTIANAYSRKSNRFLDPKAYIVVVINLCSLGFDKGYNKKDICH
jgi:hypothetical protein